MLVLEYINIAHATDRLPRDSRSDINPRLGLAGEIGSLLTQLKKEVRDRGETALATKQAVNDELGDIIWYAVTVANRAGLDFQKDVLFGHLDRLRRGHLAIEHAAPHISRSELEPGGRIDRDLTRLGLSAVETFSAYQGLVVLTSKLWGDKAALAPYLVQIWKNSGTLLTLALKTRRGETEDKLPVAKALGAILWYVAAFAHLYGLPLNDVVSQNASKIVSAFPSNAQKVRTPLFDNDVELNPLEQFPRQFNVDFVAHGNDSAVMLINGVRVGDPLRDNAYKTSNNDIDGYRFHDSIHLAFAAILGWSPVMRNLLMRKRKSQPAVDDAEDGARARIVEEMIAKIAHTHAVGHDRDKLFDEKRYINLNLLKTFVDLAEGLEVAGGRIGKPACKYWEWEEAILSGFKIYNQLRRHGGGRIFVDLINRAVSFTPLEKGQGTRVPVAEP